MSDLNSGKTALVKETRYQSGEEYLSKVSNDSKDHQSQSGGNPLENKQTHTWDLGAD